MKTKKNSSTSNSVSAPTHPQITARARELWEKAGRPEDRDLEHWLKAEHQLRRAAGLHDDAMRLSADPIDPASSDAAETDQELDRISGQPPPPRSATAL